MSSKYGENELIIFSVSEKGYIVRGGHSKLEFNYKVPIY